MIRITARRDGFRRCGVAHSKQPTEYADDHFSYEQLKDLMNDPMLVVEQGPSDDKPEGGKKGKEPDGKKTAAAKKE